LVQNVENSNANAEKAKKAEKAYEEDEKPWRSEDGSLCPFSLEYPG
jgi:hypothetical protein